MNFNYKLLINCQLETSPIRNYLVPKCTGTACYSRGIAVLDEVLTHRNTSLISFIPAHCLQSAVV